MAIDAMTSCVARSSIPSYSLYTIKVLECLSSTREDFDYLLILNVFMFSKINSEREVWSYTSSQLKAVLTIPEEAPRNRRYNDFNTIRV